MEREQLPAESLTTGIPVSVRPAGDEGTGNAISFIIATLGTDYEDAVERLQAIRRSVKRAKQHVQSLPREDPGHDHGLTEVNGKKVVSFLPWHFDHSYNDELNYAGVLRAVVAAPVDGRTGFSDGIELYKAMDPAIIRKIENLNAIYTLDVRLSQIRFGRYFKTFGDTERDRANTEVISIFPRAIHPMILSRPSGEKVAHFCGFSAVGIEGHEDAEGDAIFEEAMQELNRKVNPYWHEWRPTDLVIWDNHRMLHAVEGCDPKYDRRTIRSTIKGDYGLGYFEDGKKIGEVFREVEPIE